MCANNAFSACATEFYLEKFELKLDLHQPVHQNSSHLEISGLVQIYKKHYLVIDGTAKQMVCLDSTERLYSPGREK